MSRTTPSLCPYCLNKTEIVGICLTCKHCGRVIDAGNSILRQIFSTCFSGYEIETEATPSSFKFQWALVMFLIEVFDHDHWEDEEQFVWSGYENEEYIIRIGKDPKRRKEWRGKHSMEAVAQMLEEAISAYRGSTVGGKKET